MPRRSELKAVTITDPKAIRALAHPARLNVIETLYARRRPMTATQLAEQSQISPSAMSYHLRSLERFGIVRRDADVRDGREVPWIRAGANLNLRPEAFGTGRAAAQAADVLVTSMMDRDRVALLAARERLEKNDGAVPLDGVTRYAKAGLVLTAKEAESLLKSIDKLLEPYLEESRHDAPESAGRLNITWLALADPERIEVSTARGKVRAKRNQSVDT